MQQGFGRAILEHTRQDFTDDFFNWASVAMYDPFATRYEGHEPRELPVAPTDGGAREPVVTAEPPIGSGSGNNQQLASSNLPWLIVGLVAVILIVTK